MKKLFGFALACFPVAALAAATPAEASDRRDRIVTEAAMRLEDPAKAMERPEVAAAVRRHIESLGDDPRQLAILERFKIPGTAELLIDRAIAWGETSEGVQAVELALESGGKSAIQKVIDTPSGSDTARSASLVRILALSKRGGVQPILKKLATDSTIGPELRLPAATGLARTEAGQKALIELAEAGKLPADVMTVVAADLQASSDAKVAAAAAKLFPNLNIDDVRLPPMSELVAMRGDPENGRALFTGTATCGQCHTVAGTGKNVGPDLSEIGDKLTRDAMYVSILNPSAGISHNYEMYIALTEEGDVVNGLLVSKNEEEIILKDKDGIERKFAADEVEAIKKADKSLMPEELHRITKLDGLVDIVEYMTTLRKAK